MSLCDACMHAEHCVSKKATLPLACRMLKVYRVGGANSQFFVYAQSNHSATNHMAVHEALA